jgi:hypothetical protein
MIGYSDLPRQDLQMTGSGGQAIPSLNVAM